MTNISSSQYITEEEEILFRSTYIYKQSHSVIWINLVSSL